MNNALRESITSIFGYTITGIFSVGAWRIALDIALKQKEVKTRITIILAATAILLIVIYGIVGKMNSQPAKTMATMQQSSKNGTK